MSYEVTILLVAAKQLYEGLSDLIFRFGAEKADFFLQLSHFFQLM